MGRYFVLTQALPTKKLMAKNLRLQQMEHDLQFLIERALAQGWQTNVESIRSLPASGRPERVKVTCLLTFTDGTDVVLSATSKADCSSFYHDGGCNVKYGLLKYEMVPIRNLARFILNVCGYENESDEETTFFIESDGHVHTIDDESESGPDEEDADDENSIDDASDGNGSSEHEGDKHDQNVVWNSDVQYQAIQEQALLGDDQFIVRDDLGPSSRWSELMLWSEMYSEIRILKVDGVCYVRSEQEERHYCRITVSPECVWTNAIRWLFPPTEYDQHPRLIMRPKMQNISWMVITPEKQSAVATTRQLEMYSIISDFMTNG